MARSEEKDSPAQAGADPQAPGQGAGNCRGVARPGIPAPDFTAPALVSGAPKNIRLADYRGQWVVLTFYRGDFTIV